jgi:folate-binding protein YgfZ
MKLDVVVPGGSGGAVCWALAIDAEPASTSAAQIQWPIDMGSAYQAARQRAAFADRSSRARLLVRGHDRASYLQGLFTNDIQALTTGQGCYTAYLTPQGRMIADLWVYELGDLILLNLAGDLRSTVMAKLDQFIFSEDVQLGDVSAAFAQVALLGPASASLLEGLLDDPAPVPLATLAEHGNLRSHIGGAAAIVTRVTDMGEPGFDLYIERERAGWLQDQLLASDVPELDADTADALRIEAGVPVFHRDMDEETIPLEAGIEPRAISLTKGCYVGQEIIIRVLHRGHGRVAKKLVGLALEGTVVPPRGAAVLSDDRAVGEVTSAVRSPALARPIALAYVHRDFLAPGTVLSVSGARALVSALPFVPRQ